MKLSYLERDTGVALDERTIGQVLRERAAASPDRLALVGQCHGEGAERRLSYAELLAEAEGVAAGLRQHAEPGDLVALWAPNVVEWPIIEYGAALAGVVLVALNPVLRAAELDYCLGHSRPKLLLHADVSRDYEMATVARDVAARHGIATASLSDPDAWHATGAVDGPTDAGLPAMLQYTSGTTGHPKGVLLRHRSLVNVARLTMGFVGVGEEAVCLNPLPMFHTAACVIGTLGPLSIGGTEVLVERFVPDAALDQLEREQADVLFYVPAVLGAMLEAQRARETPARRLEVVMGGAANVPASMIEAAEQTFGASVINLFGQTELSPVLSATRPGDTRADQLGTVGHPLPQVDVKIVDAAGDVVPLGVPGEICARGYQQLVEYLHDPEATARAVDADGFVHTGDAGSLDERGYLTLTGRIKDLIIRGGENIAPAEIEACLAAHPLVLEASVFGLPDERWGEIVAVALRLREEPATVLADLRAHVRERLSPYKQPARWFVVEEFPITPTGKVQKFKLRDQIDGARELVEA